MPRAILLLAAALSLLLLPQAFALQHSFLSTIDNWGSNLLQIGSNPYAATAQTRLAATHAPTSRTASLLSKPLAGLRNKIALQLGADHPELAPIVVYLDSIVTQLDLQDAQDTALLDGRTSNHSAAKTTTSSVNATLALKETAQRAAATNCASKTSGFTQDTSSLAQDIRNCDEELSFLVVMQSTMNQLTSVGGLDLLQKTSRTLISSLAEKITSASAEAKAPFLNLNLLGGHYGSTETLNTAMQALKGEINAKKVDSQNKIAVFDHTKNEVCNAADVAASQVVVWIHRQDEALVQQAARAADFMATKAMVESSRELTQSLRASITTIKAKIQELADIPATAAIQKMPASMLQVHMARFGDIVESIKALLHQLDARIVSEASTEIATTQTKHDAWKTAEGHFKSLQENYAVQSSSSVFLGTRLANMLGTKDEALTVLDDEIESQLRETKLFNELRALLSTLAGQGSVASELATHPSTKTMLALAVGAERSHEDLVERFETLISALESEAAEKKAQLTAAYDSYLDAYTTLSATNTAQENVASAADAAKEIARGDMEGALAAYQTAQSTLAANTVHRQAEQALLSSLLTMVDGLIQHTPELIACPSDFPYPSPPRSNKVCFNSTDLASGGDGSCDSWCEMEAGLMVGCPPADRVCH